MGEDRERRQALDLNRVFGEKARTYSLWGNETICGGPGGYGRNGDTRLVTYRMYLCDTVWCLFSATIGGATSAHRPISGEASTGGNPIKWICAENRITGLGVYKSLSGVAPKVYPHSSPPPALVGSGARGLPQLSR